MARENIITVICFAIALICALVMFPLTAQLVSSSPEAMQGSPYHQKWLLDCILGIVGLVSALTAKRLSSRSTPRS